MRRSKITSGIVRNVAGAPAVGATLRAPVEVAEGWVGFLNGDNPGDGGELVATTDEQGRFVLDQLSGDLRRLFIVETTDGARAIVRNLECGQQNVEITVPERRDVIIRINGDFSRLPEGRRSRVVNVGQDIDFDTAIGNARCLVGGDATIEATGNGGIAVFRGLAIELDPSDASQQRLKVQIGSGNDVMQKADVNLIGDTRVELTLPATKSTE